MMNPALLEFRVLGFGPCFFQSSSGFLHTAKKVLPSPTFEGNLNFCSTGP
jgi:hypothetical protein